MDLCLLAGPYQYRYNAPHYLFVGVVVPNMILRIILRMPFEHHLEILRRVIYYKSSHLFVGVVVPNHDKHHVPRLLNV
jgi:hypothetical protein